jgi:3-hydroxy-9,10-secoandrosta-1,3,5(10)-triene-9,17-dione monooxygenase
VAPYDHGLTDTENAGEISAHTLISRAAAIGPSLFKRRESAAMSRTLPKETIEQIVESKILRACMPKIFGGYELPFGAHTDVAMELARSCGSTAWVSGILASHNWWLGKYNTEAQHEVWGDDADALIGAAFASERGACAKPKNGGYNVSGTWMWCSGAEHCDWVSLMAPILTPDQKPELAMVLLKKGEYKIDDVWYSPGMRATGSNNILVDNQLIPAHRLTKLAELNRKDSPGCELNTGPVYKLPMLDVFGYSVAIPTLGCAIGAIDHYINIMKNKSAFDNSKVSEFQSLQLRVAESSTEINAALSIYRNDLNIMHGAANKDKELSQKELIQFKSNCAYVATLAKRSVTRIIESMGASEMTDSNPAFTAFSDTLIGASHKALAWDVNGTLLGKQLFGLNDGETDIDRRAKATQLK